MHLVARDSLRLLARGFGLAEGPVAASDDADAVIVSDALLGGLYRAPLLAAGATAPTASPCALADRKGVGGLARHRDGGLVVTGRSLIHLTTDGREVELVRRPAGVTGYNDLCPTPEGGLLVGALRIRPMLGDVGTPGDLVYLDVAGGAAVWSAGEIVWPNGVSFTPDGAAVLVADFATGVVYRSPWRAGRPAALAPWVTTPSGHADGMSVDVAGRVWVALGPGGGVAVYSPGGELLTVVAIPAGFVSSVCHAGRSRRTLVITTMDTTGGADPDGALFAVETDVPGVALPPACVGAPRTNRD